MLKKNKAMFIVFKNKFFFNFLVKREYIILKNWTVLLGSIKCQQRNILQLRNVLQRKKKKFNNLSNNKGESR